MFSISKKIILLTLTFIVIFTIENNFVSAQDASSLTEVSASVYINISPINPKVGDTVNLQLIGYGFSLDTAKITWYVDGVATKEGTGQKSLSIKVKSNGESTTIRVLVETIDGDIIEDTKQISPSSVDIIIEPTSFVPAFYQGKSLFINQGTVRIIAIPDVVISGTRISSKNLVFRWQKDGLVLQSQSGKGRDSITINGSVPIRDININLQIIDSSGKIITETSKIISVNNPKILFYENSPLYGILFNKAITNNYFLGQKEEFKIVAKPYFFNTKTDNSTDLNYKWSINGNPVDATGKTNELLLRQTGENLKGTASVSLDVNNLIKIFQFTSATFDVTFGE